MTKQEKILGIVADATGIPKEQIRSRSRVWPLAEARLLYVLKCSAEGIPDGQMAKEIDRARVTMLKLRQSASDYKQMNRSFAKKYNKIEELYEAEKIHDTEE